MVDREPQSQTIDIVASRYTTIELGTKEELEPLLQRLPDYHYQELCRHIDTRKDSALLYSSLACIPESSCNDFYLCGNIVFNEGDTGQNQHWAAQLISSLDETFTGCGVIDPDDQFPARDRDTAFFVRLSRDIFAQIEVEQHDERQQSLAIRTITREQFYDEMGVAAPIEDEPAAEEDRYEALKKFATLWAYAHDVIAQNFDTHAQPAMRSMSVAPPHESIYMPEAEIIRDDMLLFRDIAGYDTIKEKLLDLALLGDNLEIADNIGLESTHGILLHGEPGTGKTSLLRAFANEIDAELVELPVSQVIDKWVGSSAQNMDTFFDELKQRTTKTVLLMDEFDSIGVSDKYAGSNERIDAVNRLKEHIIDIAVNYPHILLTGATNKFHRVDEGLIRPGRFLPIEVQRPNEHGRQQILSLMLGKVGTLAVVRGVERPDLPTLDLAGDIDVNALARAGEGLVGAHFNEVLNDIRRERIRTYAKTHEMPFITQAELIERIKQATLNVA